MLEVYCGKFIDENKEYETIVYIVSEDKKDALNGLIYLGKTKEDLKDLKLKKSDIYSFNDPKCNIDEFKDVAENYIIFEAEPIES